MDHKVFIAQTKSAYPQFPYDDADHSMFAACRQVFGQFAEDPDNPFAAWLKPGNTVVIKPNWVMHCTADDEKADALLTNTGLIKHVIDCAARGLNNQGRIIIGDAPLQSCDFDKMVAFTRIAELLEILRARYPDIEFIHEDWRLTTLENEKEHTPNADSQQATKEIDPSRYVLKDRGRASFLEDLADYADEFRVSCYKPSLMFPHHHRGTHRYCVTKRIFEADLMINMPKMKTHMKAGLTGALKNLIGINGHKEFLPHYIRGSFFGGGDSYCNGNSFRDKYDDLYDEFWEHFDDAPQSRKTWQWQKLRALSHLSHARGADKMAPGGWSGNETIWRTTLDLNHVLYFSEESPKKILNIVDGIVAGEGKGPLSPTPKPIGMIIVGDNPAYVDAVIAQVMGYNISRIQSVYHAIYNRKSQLAGPFLEDWDVSWSDEQGTKQVPFEKLPNLDFAKPEFWRRAARGSDAVPDKSDAVHA
ncbi:MAG: hypothetical protein ACI9OD_003322 [Limisphaerales bacterium]|jgi:uncharacterized protein (DUF362 family)